MGTERVISTRVKLTGDQEFKKKMRGVSGEVKQFSDWTEVLKGILSADAIKKGFETLANGIRQSIDASVEFESSMAGIRKTTDMTSVELEAMGEAIKKMAEKIPMSTTELAKLVELGGQLGVPKDNLLEFAETMAELGVSTDLSGEQAAAALAKLANIMQTSQDDYDRMGSSIVALGNNMATTESDILNMSERMAAAGKAVGMTEADIFALSATLSSLGVEAEAGGSAMSKLMKNIETMVQTGDKKLPEFAKVAGMSAKEFADTWKKDPMKALEAFVTGLGELDEKGGNSIVTLEKLGITEVRQSASVLALSKSNGLLKKAVDLSNQAWNENNALSKEAATRYETTESKIQTFNNSVNNLAIAVGDKLKPMLMGIMEGATGAIDWLTRVIAGEKDLRSMISEADKTYAETEEEMEAAALQAEALIDRLAELEGKPELTAAEQREWNATLERLQEIMPSTTALIDQNTGAIEGGTAALRLNTEEAKRNALEVAKQAALREKYEAYYIFAGRIADKQVELTLATRKAADAEQALADARERENKLVKEAEANAKALNEQYGGYLTTAADELEASQEYHKLQQELEQLAQESYDAAAYVDQLNYEIEQGNVQLEDAAATVREYEEALSSGDASLAGMTKSQEELTDAAKEQVREFGSASVALDDLIEKQNEAYADALQKVNGIVSGFGKIEMPKPKRIKDTIKDLETQRKFMETYQKNLEKVQEMGLSDELVQELSDGSAESAAILQGIVNDGGKNIEKLNQKFAEVSKGKEAMAQAMAEAQTDFQNKANSIIDSTNEMVKNFNQKSEAYNAAAETVQGVIDGMNSKLAALRKKYNEVRKLSNPNSNNYQPNDNTHSRAAGISFVPYDNYNAMLHRGEMVLTALEAKAYRAEQYANYASPIGAVGGVTNNSRTVNNRSDLNLINPIFQIGDNLTAQGLMQEWLGTMRGQIAALGGRV